MTATENGVTRSLSLLPDPLSSELVVPVKFPSMYQSTRAGEKADNIPAER